MFIISIQSQTPMRMMFEGAMPPLCRRLMFPGNGTDIDRAGNARDTVLRRIVEMMSRFASVNIGDPCPGASRNPRWHTTMQRSVARDGVQAAGNA
jgi:hypothetical protein